MDTIGEVRRRGTVQKWGQNKKIPSLKFYSEKGLSNLSLGVFV